MPKLRLNLPVFLLTVSVGVLPAQRADSASVARAAFAEAGRLLAAGDTVGASERALHATTAWPMQGGYLVPVARLAALAGRSEEAIRLLQTVTRMGFAWKADHPALRSLDGIPEFANLRVGAEANSNPMARSTILRRLPDSTLHPEGVAFDAATGRLFVSSVRHRKVIVIEADGRVRDFTPDAAPLEAVFGLAVDSPRGMLWLATSRTPEQATVASEAGSGAAIVGLDLATGRIRERWSIADTTAPHLLGEVVLAPDGAVWATDSRTPGIYRTVPDGIGGALPRAEIHSPDWASLQGLAFDARGRVAWLADWTTGLYRLDLVTGRVTPVAGAAYDFTLGIDGLYLLPGGDLIATQNGITPPRVIRLRLTPAGDSIANLHVLDRHLPIAEEPTLGVLVDGSLVYVANSPWGYYRDGQPVPGAAFPLPALLRLPLEP